MRLMENTSEKIASEPHRKPRKKYAMKWTTMMMNRFKDLNLTWEEASESSKDRAFWRNLCRTNKNNVTYFFYE